MSEPIKNRYEFVVLCDATLMRAICPAWTPRPATAL